MKNTINPKADSGFSRRNLLKTGLALVGGSLLGCATGTHGLLPVTFAA